MTLGQCVFLIVCSPVVAFVVAKAIVHFQRTVP